MSHLKILLTALFITALHQSTAFAALGAPYVYSPHPLEVKPESLSDIVWECESLSLNDGCKTTPYDYWCHVAKKPSLIVHYFSSIPTIEEFKKTESSKGLTMCSNHW